MGLGLETGCLLPLDISLPAETLETLASESAGLSHASYTYSGHQWALASDAAMQASSYRPDLLTLPFPETWSDVVRLGEALRREGRFMALPLCPTDAICSFVTLCASHGSRVGNEDRFVDSSVGMEALRLLVDFVRVSHERSLDWNPIQMLDHMSQTDEIAYCPLNFCYTNYSRDSFAPKLVKHRDIPGISGAILGGAGIAVSSQTNHPHEAAAYAAWLCSAEVQKSLYVENGGQPGNRLAWLDDRANELTHNFFRNTIATLDHAFLRPRHKGWVRFQEQAGELINRMLRENSSVERCLSQLSELYNATLDL
jgi:multiple sugar transport system substrate-binding protein